MNESTDGRHQLLTPREAAEMLRKSPGTLANERSQGRGAKYLRIGGKVVYRLSDLYEYVDGCERGEAA